MKDFSSRAQGLIAINIAALVFGCAALFGKLDVSPFWIVAVRASFACLSLFAFGICKKDMGIPPRKQWRTLGATGIILAIHWLTFFAAVQMAGVAIATLTFAIFPLFTVLFESVSQRRNQHPAEILAGLVIILAVALLVNPQNSHGNFWGALSGLASALTFAWFGFASKHLGKTLSSLRISFAQNLVVASVLMPFLLFVDKAPRLTADWLWLAALGVVATAVMHQLYFYGLRRLSASTCSGFVALEPVYAIVFSAILFHEPITVWVVISGVLIIVSSSILLKLEVTREPNDANNLL